LADVIVTTTQPITSLLVANRGEIARRIMRTAREMGLRTVAVYADGDAGAPFVQDADEAVALGGRTAAETYLDVAKILDAARRSGAEAVHPGYGFLSENADFARAVVEAGLVWVGPSADAIASMGDKLAAKRAMDEAGVPTLPSHEVVAGQDPSTPAEAIGYPLLVKASAGGGGKGMRVVESVGELSDAIDAARREAAGAFGDDTVFLESWLAQTRHVEVQILGDSLGNVIHCFERECSIQRRHQKIIEEAPSPALDEGLRAAMGTAAVKAAAAIGYTSAGTVEFLLSGRQFWFLEMNTRLQVEHPVTEAITGLDLVREQIRVAQGESLDVTQSDLQINGHAIEARLYAEDPDNDFLPATGTVLAWEPPSSPAARFDSGIETGSEVSIEFDPILAKVIAHAPTREQAAARLARVLERTRVQGVTTNRDFLVATLRHPAFLAGDTTTDFIERVAPARVRVPSDSELRSAAIAAALAAQSDRRAAATVLASVSSGWRNSQMPPEKVHYGTGVGGEPDDTEIVVRYQSRRDGSFWVDAGAGDQRVLVSARGDDSVTLEIDGRRSRFALVADNDRWHVQGPEGDVRLTQLPRFPDRHLEGPAGGLVAPMPGKVVDVLVVPGATVQAGDLLLLLEAMKMEHRITAPVGGVVTEVRVSPGEQVANGALLVVLEEAESGESA
jgi:propionyl-CoA carboxylase alpha chain